MSILPAVFGSDLLLLERGGAPQFRRIGPRGGAFFFDAILGHSLGPGYLREQVGAVPRPTF